MATEQEKRDQELLAPFFSKYGVGPDQTEEAVAAEREGYRKFGRGIARGLPLMAGLPADLGQAVMKMKFPEQFKEVDFFSAPFGGEDIARRMGLEREGGGLETLGEIVSGMYNPELAAKGVLGLATSRGAPFIERQIDKLIRSGKMKGARAPEDRQSLMDVMKDFEQEKVWAERSMKDVGTPWQVGTKEQLKDYMDVADDYINNSRNTLYGNLDEVEGVLYNMRKVTDELEEFGMIPLKGAPGKRDPQILEEGKIYFHNKAHSRGDFDNIDGFTSNPDLGMEIVLGGKDGMADAVINMNMYPDIKNQFGVGSLRSHTARGGQKLLNKIKGPVLDKLGIEIHMSPSYTPSWKTRKIGLLDNHFTQLDKKAGNTNFADAYKKQISDYAKSLKKTETGSQEKLVKWYKRNGFEHVSGDRGSMVRRPQPYDETKQIVKKGVGGLISTHNTRLRRP